jgi:uncharacterized protein YgiM (DUF1202 family)
MRHPIVLAVMVGILTAAPTYAQTYPAEGIILQKEVEVRSGPSKNFFPTSKVYLNEKVTVLRETQGWLEIKPPTGSFSWISGKNVKQVDAQHAFVDCDPARPVSIYAGSRLVNQAPDRESVKLTMGTIVALVNPPMWVNGETWLPIAPHPSEVRYIPSESVKPATVVAATQNSPPNWTQSPNGYVGNNVLAAAEQALKDNDVNRARQLYQQVANTATDQNQKVYALNRLASLSQSPVQGITTSLSPTNPNSVTPASLVTLQAPTWSSYGRLRDTTLKSDSGQPVYSLEDAQGKVQTYITTTAGKSLQSYIGRTISVFGPTLYRPDVRMQYVVASHVAVP